MIILKQKYYHTNYETYANIVFILICLEATEKFPTCRLKHIFKIRIILSCKLMRQARIPTCNKPLIIL